MNTSGKSIVLLLAATPYLSSCIFGGYVGPVAPTAPLGLYSLEESNVRLGEFSMEWKEKDIAFVFAMDRACEVEASFKLMLFQGQYLVTEEGEERSQDVFLPRLDPQEGKGAEEHFSGEASPFFTGFEFEGKKLSSDPYRLSLKEGRNELIFKTSGENWRLDPSSSFFFEGIIEKKGDAYTLFGGAFALDRKDLPPKNASFSYVWLSDLNIEGTPKAERTEAEAKLGESDLPKKRLAKAQSTRYNPPCD